MEGSILPLSIRYGTSRYPEKVARRLRAVNITAWLVAAVIAGFALLRSLDPTPGMWKFAAINWVSAPLFASLPLLHRFGALAAPITFVVLAYSFTFLVTSLV